MAKSTTYRGKAAKKTALIPATFLALIMAIVLGVAGALLAAMAVSLFTLDLDSLASGAGDMLAAVFIRGFIFAAGAAVIAGLVSLFFSRKAVWTTSIYVGTVVFFGNGLVSLAQASLVISPWGTYIGGGLGALIGIPLGISLSKGDRAPKGLRDAALKATRAKGTHPAEVEYWRADTDLDGFDD